MHASIRRYIVKAGQEDEAIRHTRDGTIPIFKSIPGFISYYFVHTGEGEMIGISFYETAASAEQANAVAAEYQATHTPDSLTRVSSTLGEVVAHAP